MDDQFNPIALMSGLDNQSSLSGTHEQTKLTEFEEINFTQHRDPSQNQLALGEYEHEQSSDQEEKT